MPVPEVNVVPLWVNPSWKVKPSLIGFVQMPPALMVTSPTNVFVPVAEVAKVRVPVTLVVPFAVRFIPVTLNVPAEMSRFPFSVSVVVLPPTLSVRPVLSTVMLLNVWVTAVPLIDCAAVVLVKLTVPEPGMNVPPLFVQLPALLMVVPAVNVPAVSVVAPVIVIVGGAAKSPAVNVNAPFTVSDVVLPPTLSVCPVLFTVMLLNVCVTAVPLIACPAVVLLNVTVPAPGVNVPPLFVQSPPTLMFVPAVNVPAVNVSVPVIFKVAGGVKFPCVIVRLFTLTVVVPPAVFNNVATALLTTTSLNVFVTNVPRIC